MNDRSELLRIRQIPDGSMKLQKLNIKLTLVAVSPEENMLFYAGNGVNEVWIYNVKVRVSSFCQTLTGADQRDTWKVRV
jgi:hypothetical protein